HDDEVGAVEQEQVLVAVALQEVDAGNLHRIVAVDNLRPRLAALQLIDGAGAGGHPVDIEILRQFLLPLLAEIWREQDAEASDLAAVVELAGDEQRLDGFAYTDVVGDQ